MKGGVRAAEGWGEHRNISYGAAMTGKSGEL